MQLCSKFDKEDHKNTQFLLRPYPELQIAYLMEETARKDDGDPPLFSAPINGHSEFNIRTGKSYCL